MEIRQILMLERVRILTFFFKSIEYHETETVKKTDNMWLVWPFLSGSKIVKVFILTQNQPSRNVQSFPSMFSQECQVFEMDIFV